MLNVDLYDDKYLVRFHHIRRNQPFICDHTTCTIHRAVDSSEALRLVGYGCARLHPNDNYCKNIGRKISFARALKDADMDRKERKLFWQEYFKKRGKIN